MKGFLMPTKINPDAVRTSGGKPIVRLPAGFKRDFHKINEEGEDIAYTPIQQNLLLHNSDLFALRPYVRSATGIFLPRKK